MSAKYIPIMEVVAQFLDEYDKSVGDEDKAWGMAFRGLELMHFNTAAEPKTVMLPILGNKTALLPSDYVNWNKVGIRGEDGKVLTLIINDALTEYKDLHPDRLSQITADVNNGSYSNVWLNWWSDGIYQPLFGLGYGVQNFGECRVDEKNNLIILDLIVWMLCLWLFILFGIHHRSNNVPCGMLTWVVTVILLEQ